MFELMDEPETYVLAWTTTPWTLLGNVALAVGEKLKYIKGKYIEKLGYFDPIKKSFLTKINLERISYWSSRGAEISKRVQTLIKICKNNDI